jgi:hypothetical protein
MPTLPTVLGSSPERFVAGAIEDVFRPGRGLPHFDDISFGALGFGLASDGWRVWCTHQQQSGFDSKYCTRNPDGVDPLHLVRIHELLRGSRAVRAGACSAVTYDGAKLRLFLKDDAFLLTGFRPIHGDEYEHEDLVWVISRSIALPGKVNIASCILPPLVEATRTMTKGEQFFEAARETLCLLEVDPDNPVPGLIQWLQSASLDCNHSLDVHPWKQTRRAHAFWKFIHPAARSLSDMGPSVLPALGESLKKGWTPESVQRALSVYQEIGEPSLPYLEVLLKETTGTVWEASLNAKLSIQRSLRPDYPAEKTRAAPQ